MKTTQVITVVAIVVITCALVNWVRGDDGFHIAQVFPLLGGYKPGIYDLGGLALLLIAVAGMRRIRSKDD